MNCMKSGNQYVRTYLNGASTSANRAPFLPCTPTSMETSPSLFLNSCSSPSSFFCSSVRTSGSSGAGSGSGASCNTTCVYDIYEHPASFHLGLHLIAQSRCGRAVCQTKRTGEGMTCNLLLWNTAQSMQRYNNNIHIYYGSVCGDLKLYICYKYECYTSVGCVIDCCSSLISK